MWGQGYYRGRSRDQQGRSNNANESELNQGAPQPRGPASQRSGPEWKEDEQSWLRQQQQQQQARVSDQHSAHRYPQQTEQYAHDPGYKRAAAPPASKSDAISAPRARQQPPGHTPRAVRSTPLEAGQHESVQYAPRSPQVAYSGEGPQSGSHHRQPASPSNARQDSSHETNPAQEHPRPNRTLLSATSIPKRTLLTEPRSSAPAGRGAPRESQKQASQPDRSSGPVRDLSSNAQPRRTDVPPRNQAAQWQDYADAPHQSQRSASGPALDDRSRSRPSSGTHQSSVQLHGVGGEPGWNSADVKTDRQTDTSHQQQQLLQAVPQQQPKPHPGREHHQQRDEPQHRPQQQRHHQGRLNQDEQHPHWQQQRQQTQPSDSDRHVPAQGRSTDYNGRHQQQQQPKAVSQQAVVPPTQQPQKQQPKPHLGREHHQQRDEPQHRLQQQSHHQDRLNQDEQHPHWQQQRQQTQLSDSDKHVPSPRKSTDYDGRHQQQQQPKAVSQQAVVPSTHQPQKQQPKPHLGREHHQQRDEPQHRPQQQSHHQDRLNQDEQHPHWQQQQQRQQTQPSDSDKHLPAPRRSTDYDSHSRSYARSDEPGQSGHSYSRQEQQQQLRTYPESTHTSGEAHAAQGESDHHAYDRLKGRSAVPPAVTAQHSQHPSERAHPPDLPSRTAQDNVASTGSDGIAWRRGDTGSKESATSTGNDGIAWRRGDTGSKESAASTGSDDIAWSLARPIRDGAGDNWQAKGQVDERSDVAAAPETWQRNHNSVQQYSSESDRKSAFRSRPVEDDLPRAVSYRHDSHKRDVSAQSSFPADNRHYKHGPVDRHQAYNEPAAGGKSHPVPTEDLNRAEQPAGSVSRVGYASQSVDTARVHSQISPGDERRSRTGPRVPESEQEQTHHIPGYRSPTDDRYSGADPHTADSVTFRSRPVQDDLPQAVSYRHDSHERDVSAQSSFPADDRHYKHVPVDRHQAYNEPAAGGKSHPVSKEDLNRAEQPAGSVSRVRYASESVDTARVHSQISPGDERRSRTGPRVPESEQEQTHHIPGYRSPTDDRYSGADPLTADSLPDVRFAEDMYEQSLSQASADRESVAQSHSHEHLPTRTQSAAVHSTVDRPERTVASLPEAELKVLTRKTFDYGHSVPVAGAKAPADQQPSDPAPPKVNDSFFDLGGESKSRSVDTGDRRQNMERVSGYTEQDGTSHDVDSLFDRERRPPVSSRQRVVPSHTAELGSADGAGRLAMLGRQWPLKTTTATLRPKQREVTPERDWGRRLSPEDDRSYGPPAVPDAAYSRDRYDSRVLGRSPEDRLPGRHEAEFEDEDLLGEPLNEDYDGRPYSPPDESGGRAWTASSEARHASSPDQKHWQQPKQQRDTWEGFGFGDSSKSAEASEDAAMMQIAKALFPDAAEALAKVGMESKLTDLIVSAAAANTSTTAKDKPNLPPWLREQLGTMMANKQKRDEDASKTAAKGGKSARQAGSDTDYSDSEDEERGAESDTSAAEVLSSEEESPRRAKKKPRSKKKKSSKVKKAPTQESLFDQVRRMMTSVLLDATEHDIEKVARDAMEEYRLPKRPLLIGYDESISCSEDEREDFDLQAGPDTTAAAAGGPPARSSRWDAPMPKKSAKQKRAAKRSFSRSRSRSPSPERKRSRRRSYSRSLSPKRSPSPRRRHRSRSRPPPRRRRSRSPSYSTRSWSRSRSRSPPPTHRSPSPTHRSPSPTHRRSRAPPPRQRAPPQQRRHHQPVEYYKTSGYDWAKLVRGRNRF
ncbi:serine/arginine repetitive matrix protein 2-like [Sycon ciliatum]|uniref:serine/arginine repetitive matrix protein 2-like n=1 Tax=Sycon ciliatum TaxID=27933 RepID=UPI0031F6F574